MVADRLAELAARHGVRRAVTDRSTGMWLSWQALDDLATTWARRFESLGLRAGQRVAIMEPAGVRFAALLHACLRSRCALAPISPRATGPEVERVLRGCRPRLWVRDGEVEVLPDPAPGDPGDACLLHTSGTTGDPKAVRLTLENQLASARGCLEMLGWSERDRWLLVLSPHTVGGLAVFFRALLAGQGVVTVARFEERAILATIADTHPTLLSVVPTMLERLVAAGGAEPLRRFRAILVGGAPAPAEQVRRWAAMGLRVCPTYGLTETCSQVAIVPPGRAEQMSGTAGLVCPHASIAIEDDQIVVSGPCLSPAYLVEGASRPIGPRFRTGDVGRLREDGILEVWGRRDDAILTGGETVQPQAVEAVLRAHPAVLDAAVVGEPDPLWGQVVTAWVVATGAGQDELDVWCRSHLSGGAIPRRWRFVECLPRTEGGKLLRRRLKGGTPRAAS